MSKDGAKTSKTERKNEQLSRDQWKINHDKHAPSSELTKIEVIKENKNSNKSSPKTKFNNTGTHTKILSLSKIQFVKLNDFTENSIVLSKQKYSIPWPSKILKVELYRVFVYFYGDNRYGYVNKIKIFDFILSEQKIRSKQWFVNFIGDFNKCWWKH